MTNADFLPVEDSVSTPDLDALVAKRHLSDEQERAFRARLMAYNPVAEGSRMLRERMVLNGTATLTDAEIIERQSEVSW